MDDAGGEFVLKDLPGTGGFDTVASAEALLPFLKDRADEIEALRRLPRDLSGCFAREGFYRMCAPAVYGGLELPPERTMSTIETLARADGSAAWCVFIGATSGSVLALLPPDSAREIFASPEVLLGGTFAPMGVAEAVEGGFRVEGRWAWGSGIQNADWIMGGCRVMRDGKTELDPRGGPRSRMMLAPAGEIEIHDTWHSAGLCGTGSTEYSMNGLFVPNRRAVGLGVEQPLERALYAFPQFGLLAMGIAAVTLGLARSALDELLDLAGAKTPQGSRRTLAERPATQAEVARAEAELRSARAFFYETIESAWQAAQSGGRLPVEHRRDIRLSTSHAVRSCARVVDRMYELGGGTSVHRSSRLQRIFRDVHVATQHAMVAPSTFEVTGRLLLGLETDPSTL